MCRGRSLFSAALLAALIFLLPVTAWAEEEPQFRFVLSVEGETEKQAQPGDTVTAALRLKRTDSDDGYAMYAMQDEVVYDPAFLQLLPENTMTADGVWTADVAAADGCRACYFSFVAFDGAADWAADTVVALFQFRDRCIVKFDTGGGSVLPPQTVRRGQCLSAPGTPLREGYRFTGWYTDQALTQPWDISTPVTANMTLYAGWEAETVAAGTSPWWALLALPVLAVMALRVKKSRN